MKNCTVELVKGFSEKSKRDYYYLSFKINGKEIPNSRLFIKETEILYYQDLLK